MAVFDAKTGLQKLLCQPKLQTFFEMVSIFEFRAEAKKNFDNGYFPLFFWFCLH